jgi:hypothetical protein
LFRHGDAGRVGELVAGSHDEVVEAVVGVETGGDLLSRRRGAMVRLPVTLFYDRRFYGFLIRTEGQADRRFRTEGAGKPFPYVSQLVFLDPVLEKPIRYGKFDHVA